MKDKDTKKYKTKLCMFESLTIRGKCVAHEFKTTKGNVLFWNFKLPYLINKNGSIESRNKRKVLDDIRCSFGIDLTCDLDKVTDKDLYDKKHKLIEGLSILKDNVYSGHNDDTTEYGIKIYSKNLKKFRNRNSTYNKYEIRKDRFDFSELERLVASFLLITGQVCLNKGRFEYAEIENARLVKVNHFKSYDRLEPFYQRVFTRSFVIRAENKRILKLAKCPLKNAIQNIDNLLVKSKNKFNQMYERLIVKKTKDLAPLLRESDIIEILKSVYNYGTTAKKIAVTNDLNSIEEGIAYLHSGIKLCRLGKYSEASKKVKKFLASRKVKKYKESIASLLYFLGDKVVTKEEVEENYVKKKELVCNYITREELALNYVSREELAKKDMEIEKLKKELILVKQNAVV